MQAPATSATGREHACTTTSPRLAPGHMGADRASRSSRPRPDRYGPACHAARPPKTRSSVNSATARARPNTAAEGVTRLPGKMCVAPKGQRQQQATPPPSPPRFPQIIPPIASRIAFGQRRPQWPLDTPTARPQCDLIFRLVRSGARPAAGWPSVGAPAHQQHHPAHSSRNVARAILSLHFSHARAGPARRRWITWKVADQVRHPVRWITRVMLQPVAQKRRSTAAPCRRSDAPAAGAQSPAAKPTRVDAAGAVSAPDRQRFLVHRSHMSGGSPRSVSPKNPRRRHPDHREGVAFHNQVPTPLRTDRRHRSTARRDG